MFATVIRFAILIALVLVAVSASGQTPPDDSGLYQVITITSDPATPACSRLLAALREPDLSAIDQRCKSFRFTPRSEIYLERYADSLPPEQLPIIALVRSDGGVIYKASGANIPDAAAIADGMRRMATIDQQSNPQHPRYTQPQAPYRPLVTPDGDPRFPNLRPNVIPDTITIDHAINVPDELPRILVVLVGVLITLVLAGIVLVGLLAGFFLLTK